MTDERRTPRRQARGQRRIEQILAAAAEVLAETGYEAATTNAIARHAGISPGSLYQFFSSKDEIARALAEYYATELEKVQAATFDSDAVATAPLDDLIAAVVASLVEFNVANRGFKALFARPDMPPALTAAVAPLHAALLERVTALLAVRFPELPRDVVERKAVVSVQMVRAMMPLIVAAEDTERERLVGELRIVLRSYLEAGG